MVEESRKHYPPFNKYPESHATHVREEVQVIQLELQFSHKLEVGLK